MSITIRKIQSDDTKTFFDMTRISGDPSLKYVHGLVTESYEECKELVSYLANLDFVHDYGFLVCRGKDPVGYILATQNRVFCECLDVAAFCKKGCRGLGIMTEAMFLFIDYLKSTPYKSLILDIESDNRSSISSAKKIGAYPICTVQYIEQTLSNYKEPPSRYIKKI